MNSTDNLNNDDLQDSIGDSSSASSGRWWYASNGRFVERVTAETPGATKRITKTGKEVYEVYHKNITGKIEALRNSTRMVNYGAGEKEKHSTIVVIKVGEELINIDFDQSDRYWPMFVCALPNIKMDKKVRLEPYKYTPKGAQRESIGLSVRQAPQPDWTARGVKMERDGTQRVPWRWTRENPGKMPPVEQGVNRKTGETEYYFDKRDAFLNEVVEYFIAKMNEGKEASLSVAESTTAHQAAATQPVAQAVTQPVATTKAAVEDMEDDIPNAFGPGMGDIGEDDLPF